jgi:hypothetical protein
MRHIGRTIHRQGRLRGAACFLVVWLLSGLVIWGILPWLMWVTVELLLLVHPFLASILMAWWRQGAGARDPEWRAMGKGAGAAVLVMWCNLAVIGVATSILPQPEPGRLSGAVAILAPLFLGSLLALVVGAIGGVFGALLAYNLRRGHRRSEPAVPSRAAR